MMAINLKTRMMRSTILFIIILMLISACSKHKQEKSAEELATEGKAYFEDKNFKNAIESYEKLTDWYPFSTYAKEAELKLADAHYQLREYDQAITAYTEYSKLHPSDPQAAYVLYQIGRCYYDQLEKPDRDQTATNNAIEAFRNLLVQYPESDYWKEANEYIELCMKNLAEKDMYIGKFYFKSRHYNAAMERFQSVINNYPDYGFHQEARDYIERCKTNLAEITGTNS